VGFVNSSAGNPAAPSYHPDTVSIGLGLRQLAYTCATSALLDAQGRGVYPGKDGRRQNAARALQWLRDQQSTEPFSVRWCGDLLGVDPVRLALDGVARVPMSGLRHWRHWRANRALNRVALLPVMLKQCALCGSAFTTTHVSQRCCGSQCATALTIRRRYGPRVDSRVSILKLKVLSGPTRQRVCHHGRDFLGRNQKNRLPNLTRT
jgi:hypothetical protein